MLHSPEAQKFGAVPDGFHVYAAAWLGQTPDEWKSMRVTGAQFKGQRRVPGTTMTTIVTKEEMAAVAMLDTEERKHDD